MQGLSDAGYTEPTSLQTEVLGPALDGNSMLVKARSGQGKDGAFVIPIISKLASNPSKGTKALILTSSPPRVAKIDELIWVMGYHAQVQSAQLIFKGDRDIQNEALKNETSILISNPRYFAELCQSGKVNLDKIEMLVLDDLDILLNEGDAKHLYNIIESIPNKEYQTLAFADRLARSIDKVLGKATEEIISIGFDRFELRKSSPKRTDHQTDDSNTVQIESDQVVASSTPASTPDTSAKSNSTTSNQALTESAKSNENKVVEPAQEVTYKQIPNGTKQAYIRVPSRMKITTLTALVDEQEIKRMAVFTASKRGSDRLFRVFKSQQVNVVRINSRQSPEERLEMMTKFNKGEADFILISEIDVQEVELHKTGWLINYDVPDTFIDYVSRMLRVTVDGGLLNVLSLVSDSDTDSILRLQDKQPETLPELPLPERAQKKYEEKKARSTRPAEDHPAAKARPKSGPRKNKPKKHKPRSNDDRNNDPKKSNKGDYRKKDDFSSKKGASNQSNNRGGGRRKRTEAAKLTELPQANFERLDKSAAKKESKGFFGKIKKLFGG